MPVPSEPVLSREEIKEIVLACLPSQVQEYVTVAACFIAGVEIERIARERAEARMMELVCPKCGQVGSPQTNCPLCRNMVGHLNWITRAEFVQRFARREAERER